MPPKIQQQAQQSPMRTFSLSVEGRRRTHAPGEHGIVRISPPFAPCHATRRSFPKRGRGR